MWQKVFVSGDQYTTIKKVKESVYRNKREGEHSYGRIPVKNHDKG